MYDSQLSSSHPVDPTTQTLHEMERELPDAILRAQQNATPLAALRDPSQRTIVQLKHGRIGSRDALRPVAPDFCLIAGPCSVENEAQLDACAAAVARSGARILRGGVFKPRTSPYSFQGLGRDGLRLLYEAGKRYGLDVVTEIMSEHDLAHAVQFADMIQVGARNMQNFALLRALGRCGRPVLLKRGLAATIDELLNAAEYILESGNPGVVLCERGIRTFETTTRFTLDLSAIPVLRDRTHLPVIVDPSHAAGHRRYVPALTRAARAVGADGVIVEIHPTPERACSDPDQALRLDHWEALATELLRN